MAHLDVVWYRLTVWTLKKILFTVSQCIFYETTKWNIAYEYLKIEIFSRDTNILSNKHWTLNIFGPSATTIGEIWDHQAIQSLTSRKWYAQKTSWWALVLRIMVVHWKIQLLSRGSWNTNTDGGDCLEKWAGIVSWFKERLGKKEGGGGFKLGGWEPNAQYVWRDKTILAWIDWSHTFDFRMFWKKQLLSI